MQMRTILQLGWTDLGDGKEDGVWEDVGYRDTLKIMRVYVHELMNMNETFIRLIIYNIYIFNDNPQQIYVCANLIFVRSFVRLLMKSVRC